MPATPTYGLFCGSYVFHLRTKFEADRLIRLKVIRGPKILKLGYVTLRPLMGWFYGPCAGRIQPPSLYQI